MTEHQDNWDAHWNEYADSAQQNPAQRMRHEIIARLLKDNLDNGPIRLFDIGSGQGDMLAILQPLFPTAQFLGVEFSKRGVDISRQKVPDATFLNGDLLDAPRELKYYEGWATDAVCSEVLEHVDDPAAFLRAASPYLADGARLIVTVPGGPISAFDRHIGHRQHFNKVSICRVLESAGFEVIRAYRAGFPFFNLYRLTVIARGNRLIDDVRTEQGGAPSRLALAVMAAYRKLFHFNQTDSPFGWQIVAVVKKIGD